jgi:ribosome-associated protein
MIKINSKLKIDENECKVKFIRASGPGGQNVNKVATAVQLRFNVRANRSLPEDVRESLMKVAGNRLNDKGELIIVAKRFRTQERNRQDAIDRLVKLIQKAAIKKTPRKKTKVPAAAKKRRLEQKKIRGKTKILRRSVDDI